MLTSHVWLTNILHTQSMDGVGAMSCEYAGEYISQGCDPLLDYVYILRTMYLFEWLFFPTVISAISIMLAYNCLLPKGLLSNPK